MKIITFTRNINSKNCNSSRKLVQKYRNIQNKWNSSPDTKDTSVPGMLPSEGHYIRKVLERFSRFC